MFKRILLLYKKSAYRIYFLEREGFLRRIDKKLYRDQLEHFKKAHDEHYETLKTVHQALKKQHVAVDQFSRGQKINYGKYDLIITVGGDGTFLEAAQHADHQVLLGINSAPSYSTGSFCVANAKNFASIVRKVMDNHYKITPLHRMRIKLNTSTARGIKTFHYDALNDLLICHENPAMLSRYVIKIGGKREDQKSSGLWIATASGSSAAIRSAGGRKIDRRLKNLQYRPRELCPRGDYKYKFLGGILPAHGSMEVASLMRKGTIYIDGAHLKVPFEYGNTISVFLSPKPIKTIFPQ